MISSDFIKKIRRIQITTSRLVTDVFAGQYHSVFKGQGIEFSEVRAYTPGDEIRSIDWNVTARTGQPHVKKFTEERELTVILLLDISSSSGFGSKQLKSQPAAEICSLLAFSAIKNNDRVGLIAFSDHIEKYIVPRKGTRHVLRVIREALIQTTADSVRNRAKKTDMAAALRYLTRALKRRSVVFIISDFYSFGDSHAGQKAFNFKKELTIANKKHDCVAITITDPREQEMPNAGLVAWEDSETGTIRYLDTSRCEIRTRYREQTRRWNETRHNLLRSAGVDVIAVQTDQPYWQAMVRFFKEREKRFR